MWNPNMLHFQQNVQNQKLGVFEIERLFSWNQFIKKNRTKFGLKLKIFQPKKWNNSSRIAPNGKILPFIGRERRRDFACKILAQKLKNSKGY